MSLSAVLTPLVVPPVNLAVLAALGLLGRRWRGARWVAGLGLAGLLLLAVPAVPGVLLFGLEQGLHAPAAAAAAQAIVVLGGDLVRDDAAPLHAAPGLLTLDRLREAASLARRTGLPLLVTGGIVQRGAAPVAVVMAASLHDDFGVAARWVEPVSATTWENAADSATILDAAGIRSVFVVTTAWHMRRALLAFARTDVAAIPAPVRSDPWPRWSMGELLPRASVWLQSYYALHEWIGCAAYALRAWHARA